MSTVVDRLLDNISRLGNDPCDLTNRNKQNIAATTYMLENYSAYNPLVGALSVATNQPNINVRGSPRGGINGDNIDINSQLLIPPGPKDPVRDDHQQRLFLTVPYLGRGASNTHLETQLRMGTNNTNKKSLDPNSEVSHLNYLYTPLLPSLETSINNPANCVEGIAAEGWVRGGVPSREAFRS